jgi:hypothetical protein
LPWLTRAAVPDIGDIARNPVLSRRRELEPLRSDARVDPPHRGEFQDVIPPRYVHTTWIRLQAFLFVERRQIGRRWPSPILTLTVTSGPAADESAEYSLFRKSGARVR